MSVSSHKIEEEAILLKIQSLYSREEYFDSQERIHRLSKIINSIHEHSNIAIQVSDFGQKPRSYSTINPSNLEEFQNITEKIPINKSNYNLSSDSDSDTRKTDLSKLELELTASLATNKAKSKHVNLTVREFSKKGFDEDVNGSFISKGSTEFVSYYENANNSSNLTFKSNITGKGSNGMGIRGKRKSMAILPFQIRHSIKEEDDCCEDN